MTTTEEPQAKSSKTMNYLLKRDLFPVLKHGEIVEGKFITQDKSKIFVDLGNFGVGVILGGEILESKNAVKKLKPGDKITAKIVNLENEEGYIELSLKKALSEDIWHQAKELMKNQTQLELQVTGANKGGLILDWKNINGFMPTSQLQSEHYPRVESGDKDKILQELQKFVGQKMKVVIIDANEKQKKLIFSEKGLDDKELNEKIAKYKVEDIIEGEVSGIANFGIFIKIEPGLEALAHISELDWGLVKDPSALFKIGEKIKAKIIQISDGKIFLSIKALKPDPWRDLDKKYKEGDVIQGVVNKIEKYGSLITIDPGVTGLVPLDEFESEKAMREKMEMGKKYSFKITSLEPLKQKIILSYINS